MKDKIQTQPVGYYEGGDGIAALIEGIVPPGPIVKSEGEERISRRPAKDTEKPKGSEWILMS